MDARVDEAAIFRKPFAKFRCIFAFLSRFTHSRHLSASLHPASKLLASYTHCTTEDRRARIGLRIVMMDQASSVARHIERHSSVAEALQVVAEFQILICFLLPQPNLIITIVTASCSGGVTRMQDNYCKSTIFIQLLYWRCSL